MQIEYHIDGGKGKKIDFFQGLTADSVSQGSVYYAINATLANRRAGLASTKSRGMIRGGGKKPWRQKGLGRARAGTRTSPLWRGGGTVFGPIPHDFSIRLPKKQKKAALRSALYEKAFENKITVLDDFVISDGKTKSLLSRISSFAGAKRVLLVLSEDNELTKRAARNISWLSYNHVSRLSIHDVYYAKHILVQVSALGELEKKYGVAQ